MKVQILVPSQNQRAFSVDVAKDETVAAFRRLLMKTLGMLQDASFSLIALGKILQDHCQDGTPARLYSTYRVRDKSSVFVHLYAAAKKRTRHDRAVVFVGRKRQKTATIENMDTITLPFDDFVCPTCSNDTRQKTCADCGCVKCLLKTGDPLICDQCNGYWHLACAGLAAPPKYQYWYCPDCYNGDHENVIGKEAQLQTSNNKMLAMKGPECAVVPYFHVGKIPGVSVGQTWATKELLAEWGVHRAPSKQMIGNSKVGTVSILLAYGIIEDRDDGDEFIYSGLGRNSKKKSVHSNKQIGPQTLENGNIYLAITCNAPVDAKRGARAINWRDSQPIRVCRASTFKAIHPEFAPAEGFRYDGEYKIVKYWPYTEPTTGNVIWKFLFRRDDPEMPPWSPEGRRVVTRKRLRMIGTDDEDTEWLKRYAISYSAKIAIKRDVQNRRLWDQIAQMEFWSKFEFLQYIFDEAFACSSHACSKPIKVYRRHIFVQAAILLCNVRTLLQCPVVISVVCDVL
ncbi:PUA-like domain-containing protein [Parasitella parasitica]|nr:PUA-like domain-containing protein [Parasitella parasitica]